LPPLVGMLGAVPGLGNNECRRARQVLGFFVLLEGAAHNHKEIQIEFLSTQSVVKEDDVQVMAEGQTVKHDTYGLGIVTASDQERTAIDFDDHGPKLFVTSIMVAELIGEAPATPPKTKRRRKASTAAKAAKKAAAAAAAGRS
jgi:hypothetical protein